MTSKMVPSKSTRTNSYLADINVNSYVEKPRLSTSLKSLAAFFFLAFIFISLVLPSGRIGPVNVKLIFLILVTIMIFLSDVKVSSNYLITTLCMSISAAVWLAIGIGDLESITMPIAQLKAIGVTMLIPMITYVMLGNRMLCPKNIYMTIIYAVVFIGMAKLLLLLYAAIMHVDFIGLTQSIARYFNTEIMTMPINGFFYRFEMPSDLAGPIAIYVLLLGNSFGLDSYFSKRFLYPMSLLIIFTDFISYSRYIWADLIVAITFACPYSRVARQYIVSFGLLAGLIIVLDHAWIQSIISRFSSNATVISDNIRLEELPVLLKQFEIHPIFGDGLGSYAPTFVRDQHEKFSYELQWVALLMQIGILGVAGVIVLLTLVARPFLFSPFTKKKVTLLMMFIIWGCSGFFNPYLTSSAAGAIFSFFVAVGYSLRHKHSNLPHA